MLGTCTKSPAASGFDESSKPTENIAQDSAAPAKGPASEMSTFVLRSGRIDLNYRKFTVNECKIPGNTRSLLPKRLITFYTSINFTLLCADNRETTFFFSVRRRQ